VPPPRPDVVIQDRHSVLVDYDIFVNVRRLDARDAATVQKLYKADDLDFRLKPAAAAVDRGIELPTVTAGFTGRAPDLGALGWASHYRTSGRGPGSATRQRQPGRIEERDESDSHPRRCGRHGLAPQPRRPPGGGILRRRVKFRVRR
jgi:hypothetical protein